MGACASPLPWSAIIFSAFIALFFIVLLYYNHKGNITLHDLITATDRRGIDRTDARKLIELGTWYTMTVTLIYITVHDRLTEWFVVAYLSAATMTRWLRDREKRLSAKSETTQ